MKRKPVTPEAAIRMRTRKRMRWRPHTVGFTDTQGEIIRAIGTRHQLSLGEIIDLVFEAYFPKAFGLQWPRARRDNKSWMIHEHKVKHPRQNVRIYSFLLSPRQEVTLRQAMSQMSRNQGAISAIVEFAFRYACYDIFGRRWPKLDRHVKIDPLQLKEDGDDRERGTETDQTESSGPGVDFSEDDG